MVEVDLQKTLKADSGWNRVSEAGIIFGLPFKKASTTRRKNNLPAPIAKSLPKFLRKFG
jgi:hypothetical protein